MGWNPFKKKSWKKAGQVLEKAGNDVIRDIEETGKDIEQEIRRAAEQVARETEEFFTKEASELVQKIFNEAKKDIERFATRSINEAKKGLESVADEARSGLEDAGKEIKDGITKDLPEMAKKVVEEAADALQKAVAREGLKLLRDGAKKTNQKLTSIADDKPELIDAINKLGYSLKLGPITLAYSGFYERSSDLAEALDDYVNNPPVFRRRPLIALVEALGPDSVDLGVDISAAFLVVQSDTLSIGGSLDSIPLELFTEIADAVLEALGIPE